MVWMAGDNDLEEFGDQDLAEMKLVGSTDEVNVVVQFDSMRDDRTRRYLVTADGRIEDDVVYELGETNTGDPAVATDFFRWAINRYPADRLLGVIWNHGSGIDETDVYERARRRGVALVHGRARGPADLSRGLVSTALSSRHRRALFGSTMAAAIQDRAIAFDDTSRDFLDNVELKKVLTDVTRGTQRTFDVLGFDACLMSMVEIAYQMKGSADVVVGSEELEPGEGWPYDRLLDALTRQPDLTGPELSAAIVKLYAEAHRTGDITQSALDLAGLDVTTKAIDALAKALAVAIKTPAEYMALGKALNATQRFDTADFVDLGHLCEEVVKRTKSARVKAAARRVRESLESGAGFVIAERHRGSSVGNATGVAIYFPRGPVNKTYDRLDFAKRTSWRRFLKAYHSA
jgi:hypothetical protein